MSKKLLGAKSQLTRRLVLRYVLLSVLSVVIVTVLSILAMYYYKSRIWYGVERFYGLIYLIKENYSMCYVVLLILGQVVVGFLSLTKPLQYLDEIVSVAQGLATPTQQQIKLSAPLQGIQDELNALREQTLLSALSAKEAEQRKNDLIVYLAHDLKTPLTSVIGYLNLLCEEPQISTKTRARYLGIALKKAERLEDFINEFFEITRFNLTHLTLQTETVDLTRLLEQLASEFQPALTEKNLTWQLQLAPRVEQTCDPDKLQRALDNILRNAVNYSYPGGNIALSLTNSGSGSTICVQNQGKTIPPEKLGQIFEQFFRLDAARASATGGAGLGLAIAKEIVELHGGTISAQSGQDTTAFTVFLPSESQKIV